MAAYTNAKQSIPPIFQEIMRNHRQREELVERFTSGLHSGHGDWVEMMRLVREMKEYRRSAEQALRWNVDKGSTA
jgi:hypothetical protein